jgi:RNA polymerase sigma factor (sigma-70 family)
MTDRELQALLLAGDATALRDVYERFGGAVFAAALAVTRDRGAAEDVTQIVMVALWDHPEKFQPELGGLRPWLARMAHCRSVDWVRREATERKRERRLSQSGPEHRPSTEQQVETILEGEHARLLLATLPEPERTPIQLAYFGGLTLRQVADDLAVPEGTVKGRVRSGYRRMAASGLGAHRG